MTVDMETRPAVVTNAGLDLRRSILNNEQVTVRYVKMQWISRMCSR